MGTDRDMSAAVNRVYSTSYEDIANGAPLHRNPQEFSQSREKSPNRRSETKSTSRSPNRRMPATGEAGREIRSLKKEIETLEIQNHKLQRDGKTRNKQIDALDALLQRERDALHDVLEAARKRVKDVEAEREDILIELSEESKKVLALELKLANIKAEHQKKTQILTEQNAKLKADFTACRADLAAAKDQHAREMYQVQAEHQQTINTLKISHTEAEARWASEKMQLTTTVEVQQSLLIMWREIIADLRLRLKYLKMWIWGFRRWHYNVQLLQLEAHEEAMAMIEPEPPSPQHDAFHIEEWDIKGIAHSEFGMVDADGDGTLDDMPHPHRSGPHTGLSDFERLTQNLDF